MLTTLSCIYPSRIILLSQRHITPDGKIQKHLSQETKEIIVHIFVTTRLDYLNSHLYGMSDYIIKRLQRLLNAAARIITNLGKYDHITDDEKTTLDTN